MIPNPSKKNKIVLTDYNYRRDIENRLLMSTFTVFDVDVLRELLCSSLNLTIGELAEEVDCAPEALIPVLTKLSKTGLLTFSGENITVDKEMRKYYDLQIEKFDDDFRPDLTYIQESLNKVPIQHLPNWYALPRTTDSIFETITERYLLTPKIYHRYMAESQFDDPVVQGIIHDLMHSPDFRIRSKVLREKYQLTRELFEEYMLYLEFNFICYLSYTIIDDSWKEVVTPFQPMWDYLRFLRDSAPVPIKEVDAIKRHDTEEFHFVQLMTQCLEQPHTYTSLACSAKEKQEVTEKLNCLRLVEIEGQKLTVRPEAREWMNLSVSDKAIMLYRHPDFILSGPEEPLASDSNLRRIERSLRRVRDSGFITFTEFMRGCTVALGEKAGVLLAKKGRQWVYEIPTYTADERRFIQRVIFERLYQIGLVHIGTLHGDPCFCLSAFGRHTIED